MATFFGEIRPFSSRAVDDDEADSLRFTLSIENTEEKSKLNSKLDLMIFSIGDIASAFAYSNFLLDNSSLISTMKYSYDLKHDLSDAISSPKSTIKTAASVYAVNSQVVLCQVPAPIPDEICHEGTEIFFENFAPEKVLILTSQHMSFYKRESSLLNVEPFLKCLATSQYLAQHSCSIPQMSAPNFLSNLPASLLLKCEVSKTLGLCIVNYVDTRCVDSIVVEVFNSVLTEPILSIVDFNHDASKRLQKYIKFKTNFDSNLYS